MNQKPFDHVASLPDSITNHYIFRGGLLGLRYANGSLTYSELSRRIKQWHNCGDATLGELELAALLQAEVDSFEARWEF